MVGASLRGLYLNKTDGYHTLPFKCISIYGLETELRNTVCSWVHPVDYYITQLHSLGFTTLRIPLSMQYIIENNFQVLDQIFYTALFYKMQVIVDFHRVGSNHQEASPDVGINEHDVIRSRDEFKNLVLVVLSRYKDNHSLVGLNSWNEYTGTDMRYKQEWDQGIFDLVERSFPNRYIYFTTGLVWGGILQGYTLEYLPYANRIFYSTHKYHFSGSGDRQDWEASFGNAFPAEKIVVGEWGFRDPEDMDFGNRFSDYLLEKGIKNQCFWTISHSGDTGKITVENSSLGTAVGLNNKHVFHYRRVMV